MAETATERSRKWRQKQAALGGRNLSVWLEPETAQKLDELIPKIGKVAEVIARAVDALHTVACNVQGEQPLPLFDQQQPEESAGKGPSEIHPALAALKAKIDKGESVNDLRADFSEAATALTGEGLSQRKIAALLNEADFPTFSGSGKWGKTTVGRLLKAAHGD